ncbi:hypothetical protein RFI_26225 [Reticulomyxa filosa]|uniref:Uncharacterized protein n=1 Tax=Reticulomyxa filosa TaxID=46433 RepID=X6MBB4_RETFI|nr:hypothetical protein RFI_26225 [Reticulomyxa filosa]|eukprot:ETO11154.1 hypothetical protein RFI_26225 [Reticulomyxa filosa]
MFVLNHTITDLESHQRIAISGVTGGFCGAFTTMSSLIAQLFMLARLPHLPGKEKPTSKHEQNELILYRFKMVCFYWSLTMIGGQLVSAIPLLVFVFK